MKHVAPVSEKQEINWYVRIVECDMFNIFWSILVSAVFGFKGISLDFILN